MAHYHPHIFKEIYRLIYPATCYCCGTPLVGDERMICTQCMAHIPYSYQISITDNLTEQRLGGRIPLEAGGSLLLYKKGLSSQTILHQIKYYGNTRLAKFMGRQLGTEILQSKRFDDIDIIVPVPLHWRRKWERGYNQSEIIAKGIAQILKKPIINNALYRKHYTQTQTHKNREERYHNMQGVFATRHTELLKGKHILLVDDVITTGTTSEACCIALKGIPGLRISVVSLAIVHNN